MTATRDAVQAALATVVDPGSGKDLISAGMAKAISVTGDGVVSFVVEVDPALGAAAEPLRAAAQAAAEGVAGVTKVTAVLTAHAGAGGAPKPPPPKGPPPDLKIGRHPTPTQPVDKRIPGVDKIIAVASGKGGVGKSTLAANLAVALTG
ncbi:MAG: iron-sulfur cluster assembly protein, partial [Pseudomonadota bacterium]